MTINNVEQAIVWLDLETGGLNGRLDNGKLGEDYYPILEIAIVVTDFQLNELGAMRLPIHTQLEDKAKCHEWALKTHLESGLLNDCDNSPYTLEDAETVVLALLKSLGIKSYDRKTRIGAFMAGNSIAFDRSFIKAQLPALDNFLHYRQLDVSALNLTARILSPDVAKAANKAKEYKHEALADIRETIEEFKFYQKELIQCQI